MKPLDTGIVVPTLGTRSEYLLQSLQSIRAAGDTRIHIVMPASATLPGTITPDLYDEVIADPGLGLSTAIHVGLTSFPADVKFMNWLGDDDLLKEGSLERTSRVLRSSEKYLLVFGQCQYINAKNQTIFINRSGRLTIPLMRFGPQLVPQPGALFRRASYEKIGGLRSDLKWAFDLDLLIRLARAGHAKFVPEILGTFRWHDDSLSVGGRDGSVNEASSVRKQFLPRALQPVSELWEYPMRKATILAGKRVSKRGISRHISS